jgi:uncharacterized protein YkwD
MGRRPDPKGMRLPVTIVAAALTGALALPGAAQAQTSGYTDAGCAGRTEVPTPETVGVTRTATLCLINQERTKRGLGKLKPVDSLESVAHAYAQRMVRQRFFEHTSPDGGTFLSRIKRTTYLRGALRRWSVGENIAWGTGTLATPDGIVKAWMKSPGHRRNILNGSFHELGLGVALGAPQAGANGSAATYVNEFGERRR